VGNGEWVVDIAPVAVAVVVVVEMKKMMGASQNALPSAYQNDFVLTRQNK
jgi:hypothetical protein